MISALSIEDWIQYLSMAAAIIALFIGRRGMKPYVSVAVFAALYSDIVCDTAVEGIQIWTYPSRLATYVQESLPIELVVVPVIAMFWVRYCPPTRKGTLLWAVAWAAPLTMAEYFCERHTMLIEYLNGYDWYHSFVFWIVSLIIWLLYHKWLHAK